LLKTKHKLKNNERILFQQHKNEKRKKKQEHFVKEAKKA
jgi:hypothetical protein